MGKRISPIIYGAEFEAILATGLQKVVLNSELYPNGKNPSGEDTDMDGLSDWDEVDFANWVKLELIKYDENNSVILPTIDECIDFVDKNYVSDSLDRFKENYLFDMSLSDVE